MTQRSYEGYDGRRWTVRAVFPADAGRLRDRRMCGGWLAFTSECGDSVCVAPVPREWTRCDREHLEALRLAGRYAGYSDRAAPPAADASR